MIRCMEIIILSYCISFPRPSGHSLRLLAVVLVPFICIRASRTRLMCGGVLLGSRLYPRIRRRPADLFHIGGEGEVIGGRERH